MQLRRLRTVAFFTIAQAFALTAAVTMPARAATLYPTMLPLDRYLMGRADEVTLARSAAPASISKDAEIRVLGRHGYRTASTGTNGFVCLVERSWTKDAGDPDFWNPTLRAPICFNPPAARSDVPITLKKTEMALAGRSKSEIAAAIGVAIDNKKLPSLERGAMCYMMSKQQILSSTDGHWHPHVMFFVPLTDPGVWGAGQTGSPIYGFPDKEDRMTIFMIPVGKWSDGTEAMAMGHT